MERNFGKISITEKGERALRGGHPWVYADEVTATDEVENGAVVDVFSQRGRYLGSGFYNGMSKIRVRVISDNANDRFDEAFFQRRIKHALLYRRTVMPKEDRRACRLIFGEADRFPGFTVDRFENILVTQTLSLGIELRKDMLYRMLVEELRADGEKIDAVYERNDVAIRALEGMDQYTGFYRAEGFRDDLPGIVRITENGILYDVDYMNGQKTGFFLDQKYNRRAAARLAEGKNVLDCFTHTGAFALNTAAAGAASVTAVDVSADALAMAKHNARLNGLLPRMRFLQADVFDLLTDLKKKGGSPYDFIILDPPAFTKSSATKQNAYRGYKEINKKAMQLLPRGGYLATCSCSHFMTEPYFCRMLHDAAMEAGVSLRQIEGRKQSPDHPILWNVPETEYLKFYLFQIV